MSFEEHIRDWGYNQFRLALTRLDNSDHLTPNERSSRTDLIKRLQQLDIRVTRGLLLQQALHYARVRQLLIKAVNSEELDQVQELRSWGLTVSDLRSNDNMALRHAILNSDLDLVQELRSWIDEDGDRLSVADLRSRDNEALRRVIENGDQTLLQWLRSWVDEGGDRLTVQDTRSKNNFSLRSAARRGNVDVIQELFSWVDENGDRLTVDDANLFLIEAVKSRSLNVVQYLRSWGLTIENVNFKAIIIATEKCQLKMIQEFRSWGLTVENARPNRLLQRAATEGCLDVIRELRSWVDTGGDRFTLEDARSGSNGALWGAAKGGHLKVVQELRLWGLTVEDARSNDNRVLRIAAANGHSNVIKELRSWVDENGDQLTLEDVRSEDNYALKIAAANGRLGVIKELRSWVDENGDQLTLEDVRSEGNYALKVAFIRSKRLDVVLELQSWGLTLKDAKQAGLKGKILKFFRSKKIQLADPTAFENLESCLESNYSDIDLAVLLDGKSNSREKLCQDVLNRSWGEEVECELCVDDLVEAGRDLLKSDRCNHIFHKDCLKEYWKKKKGVCPVCESS